MNVVIPEILAGGVGRSIQGMAGSMSRLGNTAGKVISEVERNNKTFEDQQNLVEASRLENDMALEKRKSFTTFERGDDGTNAKYVDQVREEDERIGQGYISKSSNDKVREYLTKVHLYTQKNTLLQAEDGQQKRLWNTSVENMKIQTDNVIRRSAPFADFDGGMRAIEQYVNSQAGYFGANTPGLSGTMKARFTENIVKLSLSDPVSSPVMLRRLADPEEKEKIFKHIPGDKIDDMEKLIASAKDKHDGANAFIDTLAEADATPEVRNGKIGKMDMAQKIWMQPDTIKKYNLTDKAWREGMLNFKASLDFRDAQDEKNAGASTVDLTNKYSKHQLRYSDVEKTFEAVSNPALKAKYIEHWTHLLDSQASQQRAIASAERGAIAAERSARAAELSLNPFNVDVPEVKARLLQKSIETPFAPGLANEVNLALGNGISSNTYKAIMGNLQGKSVWKTPAGKELYRILNQDRKDYQYSTNEKENAERYGEMLEHYKEYLEKYPNATPKEVLSDYETKKKEMRKGAIRKFIENTYDQVTR